MIVKQLILLTSLLLCTATATAATIFVSPTGTGNGSSWQQVTDLATAVQLATSGDQVWFSTGIFYPTYGTDRNATIEFAQGVSLFGGFLGNETTIEERLAGSTTILSGNIGASDSQNDNSYTVLLLKNATNMVIIDGFTIQDGAAKGYDETHTLATAGAALFIEGGKQPTIRNCNFINNTARFGGAVYIKGTSVQGTAPLFLSCSFVNNKADFEGGAVINNGANGFANPVFKHCEFNNNKSDYGAAIFNNGTDGNANPLIFNCKFINNFAVTDGAVVYNLLAGRNGIAKPIINGTEMTDNKAQFGNEVSSSHNTASLAQPTKTTGGRLTPVSASVN